MKTNFLFNKKIIGYTEEDTYYTERRLEHFFHKFHGWGCSVSILAELQKSGVDNFCVIFRPSIHQLKEYKCKVTDFYELGEKYTDEEDKQLVLNVDHFKGYEKQVSEIQSKL